MKVTGFVKYDLYPHYIVLEGDLQENFDLKTSCGTFSHNKVLAVKPFHELAFHKTAHTNLLAAYDEGLKKLKVDLLQTFGVDFLQTKKL